jgi:Na+-driven multidrug efflux pump
MFLLKNTQTRLSWKLVMWKKPRAVLKIMATGIPSLLRQGLNSLTTMILNLQCAPYGDAAVAAMSIVSRLIFFSFSLVIGIGQGFQPVSGYNYGAGKYERLRKAFRFTLALSEGVVILASAALIIFSGSLIGLFRDDPEVIAIGTRALQLQAFAQVVLPFCSTAEMLYQSTGHRVGASLLSCLRSGALFIPLLFLMSWWRGLAGIQEAQPLAQLLSVPIAILFELRFFRQLRE